LQKKFFSENEDSSEYIAYYGCSPDYRYGAEWPRELLPYDPPNGEPLGLAQLPDPLEERCEYKGITRIDPRTNEFLDIEDALSFTACSCADDLCNDQWPRIVD